MKSIYSWVRRAFEVKEEEKVDIDPFQYPKLAADDWPFIYSEYSGKEREGLPFAWGEAFPFLEGETLLPEFRIPGPYILFGFSYRNNSKNIAKQINALSSKLREEMSLAKMCP